MLSFGSMSLTRPEAVTISLYLLGGAEAARDTEDVAIRVAELAPGMFSWKHYPERIDKELVRVALSDARLKKEWVIGSHNKGGWLLTTAGLEFARSSEGRLRGATPVRRTGSEERKHERERARMLSTPAFLMVQNGDDLGDISADEADAFFRINVYVEGQARERKIARIENQFGDDAELGEAVRALASIARGR